MCFLLLNKSDILRLETPVEMNMYLLFEPRHEKTNVLHMRKQRRRSASQSAKLISAFVFATYIVHPLYFLNPKFQVLAIFCICTALFVSDLVGNQNVGSLMTRLICKLSGWSRSGVHMTLHLEKKIKFSENF